MPKTDVLEDLVGRPMGSIPEEARLWAVVPDGRHVVVVGTSLEAAAGISSSSTCGEALRTGIPRTGHPRPTICLEDLPWVTRELK